MLQEYLLAVNELTISEENRLKLEVKVLETEREKEIQVLRSQLDSMQKEQQKIAKALSRNKEDPLPLEILAHALDPSYEGRDPKRSMSEWQKERHELDKKYGRDNKDEKKQLDHVMKKAGAAAYEQSKIKKKR